MRSLMERVKIICYVLSIVTLLSGCDGNAGQDTEKTIPTSTPLREMTEYEFVEDVDLEWKDNSLDDWQAVVNHSVEEEKADGEQLGGALKYMACEGGAVRFKNHLIGSYTKNWSGVNGIRPSGEVFSKRISVEPESVGAQIDLVGPISGKNGYVAYKNLRDANDKITGQAFYVLDENFECVHRIQAGFLFEVPLSDFMGDGRGNFHVTFHNEGSNDYKYVILSHDGEKLFESTGAYFNGLRAFGDGCVAICEQASNGRKLEGQRMLEADLERGSLEEIGYLSQSAVYELTKSSGRIYYVTLASATELAWCGSDGVYLSDSNGSNARMAYCWVNHGIQVQNVVNLYVKDDGTISILYVDAQGVKYLLLQPTVEKAEITSISFAVAPFHKETYVSAAALFNQRYPSYHIEVRDDYDETRLLTQLGAGEGPVLIDTTLTGFEDMVKLWQPLDGFLDQTGLAEELIPETLDFGQIEGKTYGIVTHFFIRALAVKENNLTNWGFEGFLNCVEKFEGAIYTAQWFQTPEDERRAFFDMLSNGLPDNAYFDIETGYVIFGTPEFERLLRLSEKAKNCPETEDGRTLKEEKALCEMVNVSGAEGLVRLRKQRESGEAIVGYPTKNGARYLLFGQSPIVVRSTATDEEKKIAYSFFRILLSRESAIASVKGNTYAMYSVRKDALENQFDYYEFVASEMKEHGDVAALPELDRKKDRELFEELMKNAVTEKQFPASLRQIFEQEFDDYLGGRIDGKALADHLKSRVTLYLDEQ